ncbi:MAG: delta-aminolevulinic acid dehydratase [Flavobacteriaceae bacterium]|nr:delta-aminolevulinic acid dehydratase [Flavobacteriaceae bacterium]|tara:strand:- start:13712 stop:14875 length:1164 start_codon:yes stop_codon:yes gene_type:complete
MKNIIDVAFDKLLVHCESQNFKGWDPYDGLNSWIIQKTFLCKSRIFRLAWIQLFKRNPINLRTIFGIKKEYNPKGLGLFLIGYCNLYSKTLNSHYINKIEFLSSKLLELQSTGFSGACWGYNFDWQARAFYQPKFTPTVVATSFIVEALLKSYEITKNDKLLKTAVSSSKFILTDLNKTYDSNGNYILSYSPLDSTQVYNAGLLGAKALALIFKYTAERKLINEAKKIVDYVCSKQNIDGSWYYSSLRYHQWIDNFHTGYNIECIYIYQSISRDNTYQKNISIGLNFYLTQFFTQEGISKYYNDKTYPIDIHSPAQLLVTLAKTNKLTPNLELIEKVISWTINNMQSKKGYFYYQKRQFFSSKIPYIRWAQAWMFYSLSYYYLQIDE